MPKARLFITLLTVMTFISGCSGQTDSTNTSSEPAPQQTQFDIGAENAIELEDSLRFSLEDRRSGGPLYPFFIEDITVKSDPDYQDLKVITRGYLSTEDKDDFRVGRTLAVPKQQDLPLPDASKAFVACYKDAMHDLTKWTVFLLTNYPTPGLPLNSLRISIEYYVMEGKVSEDEFGNDTSQLKEKVVTTTFIHISRDNLSKITNAFAPDDYYKIADMGAQRHPSQWNQCRSYKL